MHGSRTVLAMSLVRQIEKHQHRRSKCFEAPFNATSSPDDSALSSFGELNPLRFNMSYLLSALSGTLAMDRRSQIALARTFAFHEDVGGTADEAVDPLQLDVLRQVLHANLHINFGLQVPWLWSTFNSNTPSASSM